jgi:hypothetical protein
MKLRALLITTILFAPPFAGAQSIPPTDTLRPKVPTDTLRPKVPTDTLPPKVPTDTLRPKVPTDTLQPKVPTDTLRPKVPTDTLAPKDSIAPAPSPRHEANSDSLSYAGRCTRGGNAIQADKVAVGAVFVGGNAMLYRYFKRAWWSGERAKHFFFRADWDEDFRDQDKFGHLFGGFQLARIGDALLRDACASKSHAMLWSAAYAAAFQLQIEIWDGMYKKYGFSYADVIANTTGMAFAVAQEKYPRLRVIKPTMSYSRSAAMRNARNLPGELRPSLDYSGQTYWFSADVNAMLPDNAKMFWPSFLRLSAGYSITDWVDPVTGNNKRAQRKLLLSIDLDLEKLPGDNPIWRTVKRNLSYVHLPSPALQFTPKFDALKWYR